MMSLADILQLVVLCALLFFPLGYRRATISAGSARR